MVYRPDEVIGFRGSTVTARRDKQEPSKETLVTSALFRLLSVRVGHHVQMCRCLSYDVGRHPSQYHSLPFRTGKRLLSPAANISRSRKPTCVTSSSLNWIQENFR